VKGNSQQWAQEKLGQANTIFEPDEVPWHIQLCDLIVWALEVGLICYLAFRFFP
jgi:hypothetical protein